MWLAGIFIFTVQITMIVTFWLNGISFLYQQGISLLYTTIFITGCINFDKEIMTFCEQSGFILRSSRRNKFYIFFASISIYVVIYAIALSQGDAWSNKIDLVENALIVSQHFHFTFSFFNYQRYREACAEEYAANPKAIN